MLGGVAKANAISANQGRWQLAWLNAIGVCYQRDGTKMPTLDATHLADRTRKRIAQLPWLKLR